jgi:hypothetical protein
VSLRGLRGEKYFAIEKRFGLVRIGENKNQK